MRTKGTGKVMFWHDHVISVQHSENDYQEAYCLCIFMCLLRAALNTSTKPNPSSSTRGPNTQKIQHKHVTGGSHSPQLHGSQSHNRTDRHRMSQNSSTRMTMIYTAEVP